jgi:hypothetical protein
MTNKMNKKFIGMGIVALTAVYGVQGVGVSLYNEYVNSSHEMKMVTLYNKIWPEIEKKDLNGEIQEYKKLASSKPENYQFGIYPTKQAKSEYNSPSYLPSADAVEQEAKKLNRKVRLF